MKLTWLCCARHAHSDSFPDAELNLFPRMVPSKFHPTQSFERLLPGFLFHVSFMVVVVVASSEL